MGYSYSHSKIPYLFWFLFYFFLFWSLTGFNLIALLMILGVYTLSVSLAFSNAGERLWRTISGVRPLRIRSEKLRLLPLFKEVYVAAVNQDPDLSRSVQLYIREDMSINAFAFGRKTLVLTRGSIELLSDDCLKGLIAHELGHFAHADTVAALVMAVGNFFFSLLMKYLYDLKKSIDLKKQDSIIMGCVKFVYDFIYYFFRGIQFLSELILMYVSRQNEYMADLFALDIGFGEEMTFALIEIYQAIVSRPQTIKELIKSTHPPITKRIEALEMIIYQNKI